MQAPIFAEPLELNRMSGLHRAASLMLALGRDYGGAIWSLLSEEEVRELSTAMAELGHVPATVVEYLLVQFSGEVSSMTNLHGSFESTERLLLSVMSDTKAKEIMEDIRGPSGRTMWDKLSNVNEAVLAAYLKNEYPQTVAVILHKLRPDHAARVLSELPPEFSIDVIMRMLRMDTVQKEVLEQVAQTLKSEFISNLSRTQKRDPHELMAEVFNALDRSTEEKLLQELDERSPEAAERIRALMFTFEDLSGLIPAAIQSIIRKADKRALGLALKGATEETKELFFSCMTERASKMLREDMAGMGPVRLREVEDAQTTLVRLAKELADAGEILLVDPKSDDALVY